MDRRAFLRRAAGAGVCGGLAGCADPAGSGATEGVAEREPPERPDELEPESVAEYVAGYEEVHAHNRHVTAAAVEVTVDAVATVDHVSGDDHYATAQHAGSVSHEHGGDRSVGELYGGPVPYLVTPNRTLRLDVRRETVDPDGQVADGTDGDSALDEDRASPPLGVRILNVTEEARELALTVTRRSTSDDTDADETVADETVADLDVGIDPETAVEVRSITDLRGGYRVIARMEDDGVTGEGRINVGLPSADRGPNVDVVLDGSGVSTRHLPSFEGV